jgi:hypothetical protein
MKEFAEIFGIVSAVLLWAALFTYLALEARGRWSGVWAFVVLATGLTAFIYALIHFVE